MPASDSIEPGKAPDSSPIPSDLPGEPGLSYNPGGTNATRILELGEGDEPIGPTGTISAERAFGVESGPEPEGMGFKLVRILGKGGMGEVWEGVQRRLRRVVAVKRLRLSQVDVPHTESNPVLRSFRGEAMTAALLDHPNIVPVYDLGFDEEGWPLLAMKLVRGHTWDAILRFEFENSEPEEYVARHLPILAQVAQAVAFAHSREVIHRDLKPSQVMIGEYGEVLLMDWGLAMMLGAPPEIDGEAAPPRVYPSRDSAVNPAGTPGYMAPEQTEKSSERVGTCTDVYLLGGMLYTILTGRMPHHAKNSHQAFLQAAAGDVPSVAEAAPERPAPPELAALAMEALAADPEKRTPSARAFHDRLQDYLSGATRRRESLVLTRRVAARDWNAKYASYRAYVETLGLLDQAARLWSGNPDVPALRERTLEAYARLALAQGDLVLARAQAEALLHEHHRDELLESIDLETARRIAQRARVRQLTVAAFVLLIAIIGGSIAFSLSLRAAGERVRVQLAATQEARNAESAAKDRAQEELDYSTLLLANTLVNQGRNEEALVLLEKIPPPKRDWEWGFVLTRALRDFRTIPMEYLAVSPSRKQAFAVANPGGLAIVEAMTGRVTARIGSDRIERTVSVWSRDEGQFALGGRGVATRVISTSDGRVLANLDATTDTVTALEFSPDGTALLVGHGSGAIRMVDARTGEAGRAVEPHGSGIVGFAWCSRPDRIASVSRDFARLEDARNGEVLATRPLGATTYELGKSDASRRYFALVANTDTACVLELENAVFTELPTRAVDFEFSARSPILVCAARGADGGVILWDLEQRRDVSATRAVSNGAPRAPLAARDATAIKRIRLDSDETRILVECFGYYATYPYPTFDMGGRVETPADRGETPLDFLPGVPAAWMVTREGATRIRELHRSYVGKSLVGRYPSFGPDGSHYALIRRGRLQHHDAETGRLLSVGGRGFNLYMGSRAVPERDLTFAFGRRERQFTIERIRRSTSEILASYTWDGTPFHFSTDMKCTHALIVAEDQSWARLHSLDSGELVAELPRREGELFTETSPAPDGSAIAAGTTKGRVLVCDLADGSLRPEAAVRDSGVLTVCWSADAKHIAAACGDSVVRVIDAASGRIEREIRLPDDPARRLQFSPSMRYLLAAPNEGAATIWDWREGRIESTLGLKGFPFGTLRFLPGEGRVVAWYNEQARFWDIHSGREVFSMDADFGGISPDGRKVILREGGADARWTIVGLIPWKESELPGLASMTWPQRVDLWTKERFRKWWVESPTQRLPDGLDMFRVENWQKVSASEGRQLANLYDIAHALRVGEARKARETVFDALASLVASRDPKLAPAVSLEEASAGLASLEHCDPGSARTRAGAGLGASLLRALEEAESRGARSALAERGEHVAGAYAALGLLFELRGDRDRASAFARRGQAIAAIRGTSKSSAELAERPPHSLVLADNRVPRGVENATRKAEKSAWAAWEREVSEYLHRAAPVPELGVVAAALRESLAGSELDPDAKVSEAIPDLIARIERDLFGGRTLPEKQKEMGAEFDRVFGAVTAGSRH